MLKTILLLLTLSLTPFLGWGQVPPTANFTALPLSVCIGNPINFTNTSVAGTAPIANYTWDFGDGFSAITTNTAHTYGAPGTYTVTLVATATNGQADAEVKVGYVTVNPRPTAGSTTTSAGCTIPFLVTFTNTSSVGTFSYSWNFGNGQTSILQNPPAQTYATVGSFNATLLVTNTTTGCSQTFSQTIVTTAFDAGITLPTTACVGQALTLTDNSTIGANSWAWAFGDGQTSTAQNPSTTYAAAGTYNVTLTSQNTGSGCVGSATTTITVNALPLVSFTANPTIGCAPATVNFTNTSPASTTFNWNFGDGGLFTGTNPPPHVYTASGSYSVTLTATNAFGCTQTLTQAALINISTPVVSFTATPVSGCAPLSVQFTETCPVVVGNPITSWTWFFGDGTSFVGQNPPAHVYPVGLYNVTLNITTTNGCVGTLTSTEYIQVGAIDFIDFSLAPSPVCAKTDVLFTDLSVISAPHLPTEVTYNWNFGDGGSSTLQNPTHPYATDTGYFDVTLIVDFRGCKDTINKVDIVYIKAPIANFTPNQTLFCNPASFPVNVQVDDISIIGKVSDNADMTWYWGDGTSTFFDDPQIDDANAGDFAHNYATYGSYTIKQLIHNTTTGCMDSITSIVHISTVTANFTTANDSVCKQSQLAMTDLSTSFAAHPLSAWSYNMGDGSIVPGSPNASYAYAAAGVYTIIFIATNTVGCADTTSIAGIDVLELPSPIIVANDNAGCAPFVVNFDNNSVVAGNGMPLSSFVWNFGDGSATANLTTNSVLTNPNHTFNTQGVFNVTMEAIDVFGCASNPDATQTITITKPIATYTAGTVQCDNVNFTTGNTSTGAAPLSYQWYLDGAASSVATNYANVFNESNNQPTGAVAHNIQLITTDVNGCKDTANSVITISIPFANFTATFSGASTNAAGEFTCPPVFAGYANTSVSFGAITNNAWNFGNSTSSTLTNPNNTFVFPGTYSPGLTITNEYGCTDDTVFVDLITINGPSATAFQVLPATVCDLTVGFGLTDTVDVFSVIWNFGDGSTAIDSINIEHEYPSIGSYATSVQIGDQFGCQVLIPMPNINIVGNGMQADFSANPTDLELAETVQFTDLSSGPLPLVLWIWNYGDGQIDSTYSATNPTHFYTLGGNIPVVLTIVDQNGCRDRDTLFLNVSNTYELGNIMTANGDGINDVFALKYAIFKSFDMVVTNRWGNVIHNATNQTGTLLWDGKTDKGDDVVDGTYFYIFKGTFFNDEQTSKQGFIEVVGKK